MTLKTFEQSYREDTRNGWLEAEALTWREIYNSTGFCSFLLQGYDKPEVMETLAAITGQPYDNPRETWTVGLRMFYARLGFNLREGMRRKDYTITDLTVGKPPLETGPLKGCSAPTEAMQDSFMAAVGCDPDYVPYKRMLEILGGLDYLIKDLYPAR